MTGQSEAVACIKCGSLTGHNANRQNHPRTQGSYHREPSTELALLMENIAQYIQVKLFYELQLAVSDH